MDSAGHVFQRCAHHCFFNQFVLEDPDDSLAHDFARFGFGVLSLSEGADCTVTISDIGGLCRLAFLADRTKSTLTQVRAISRKKPAPVRVRALHESSPGGPELRRD